jgi:hypothetical protein
MNSQRRHNLMYYAVLYLTVKGIVDYEKYYIKYGFS